MGILLAYMRLKGDHIAEADGQNGGRELVIGAVGAKGPALALEVDPGLKVAHEVNIESATVGVNGGVVMGVSGNSGVVEVDRAVAGEEVGVGMITVKEIALNTEAAEIGVLVDDSAVGEVGANFEGRSDRQVEVTGEVGAEECAAVAVVGVSRTGDVGRVGVEITAEGCEVHSFGFGWDSLRVERDGDQSKDQEKREAKVTHENLTAL